VRELLFEVLVRLAKLVLAGLVGLVVYALLVGPFGVAGTPVLALLAWIAGALVILLVETGPF
jgi:hypothetical protein